jgi:hypothetical protein
VQFEKQSTPRSRARQPFRGIKAMLAKGVVSA